MSAAAAAAAVVAAASANSVSHLPAASAAASAAATAAASAAAYQPQPARQWFSGNQGGNRKPGIPFNKKPGGNKLPPKPQQLYYCEVCKISCAGPQTYKVRLSARLLEENYYRKSYIERAFAYALKFVRPENFCFIRYLETVVAFFFGGGELVYDFSCVCWTVSWYFRPFVLSRGCVRR